MKLAKKFLALGLSVVMVCGLAACGEKKAAKKDEGSKDNQTQTSTNTGSTRTIRIGTWFAHYYDSTMQDISANPNVTDPERDQLNLDNVREVEKKYNVRIEFTNLTWDGVQESISTSILAGHPDCDIYEADLTFGIPAVANGYAQKLEDVLPADADVLTTQNIFYKIDAMVEGTYLFAMQHAENVVAGTYPLCFNKTMLDEAGLENPQDLYARGEWTWDKWREYLEKLTVDKDGDGNIDVYGFGSRWDFLVNGLVMSNGGLIAGNQTEGLSSPEVGEALDFIYNMYNVDHFARPWNVDDFNDNQNAYYEGKVACWITAAWIAASNGNDDSALDFERIWVPFPIGPSGDEATNPRKNSGQGNAYFIPVGVDNPAFVYEVFEAWQNWYHSDFDLRDADMSWWENAAATEENYAVMEYLGDPNHAAPDLFNGLGLPIDWTALLGAGENPMTAAQFQETYKQTYQDALDAFFK